ncbi:MAG TPA: acylphosphatase [Gemmatimonadaceae bacterium]|nr:acylphosphatase [Gemmatimonadaceae bacterium]
MQLHVRVRGRVQGVGFRWFVREAARGLGVSGWVRNHADGSVEVAAEGPADAIHALRARLMEGPPGASVAGLEELEPVSTERDQPFTILR